MELAQDLAKTVTKLTPETEPRAGSDLGLEGVGGGEAEAGGGEVGLHPTHTVAYPAVKSEATLGVNMAKGEDLLGKTHDRMSKLADILNASMKRLRAVELVLNEDGVFEAPIAKNTGKHFFREVKES